MTLTNSVPARQPDDRTRRSHMAPRTTDHLQRPQTTEMCIMGSARGPTNYTRLKRPCRVRVLSPIQVRDKKHVYTFVDITIHKWFVFFVMYFLRSYSNAADKALFVGIWINLVL